MNVREALQKAVSSLQTGRLGDAEAACRKILRAHRDQPDALHLLGIVALHQGKHQDAVELIDKALRRNADNAAYHANLGEAYRGLGQFDRAASAFERSLEIDPDRAEAHCGLGNVLQANGKTDDALARYDRALEINPTMAQAHYNKGNALAEAGALDEAIACYRRAVEISPSFSDASFNLGNVLAARGELVPAVSAYEATLKAAPHFANGWYNLGNALRKLGRLEGARRAYSQAIELDAALAGAHVHLGTIAKLQGRFDAALDALNRAIEIEPDNALAHSERAHVRFLQGKVNDAIAGYQRAVEIEPRFAWGLMGLSTALAHDGRESEAKEASRTAISLRRTFDWPFLGGEPMGRVVVLKGIEDSHFTISRGDQMVFKGGVSNVDTHFDRSRVAQCSFYVDGLDVGQDLDGFPDCDVIFNGISDPDAMPRCHETAKAVAGLVRVPVLNHPDAVAKSLRHLNYQAMRDIDGIVFPKTLRLDKPVATKSALTTLLGDAGIDLPVLVRTTGTHAGESLEKADTSNQLWDYFSAQPAAGYFITQFHDCTTDSGDYAKMRFHVIDHALYPNQFIFSDDWNVQGFPHVKQRMLANPWMIERASRFLSDPEGYLGRDAYRAVSAACDLLPLDYFGIDFNLLPDGRILVFEANANMQIPNKNTEVIEPRKACIEAIEHALNRLLEKKIAESRSRIG